MIVALKFQRDLSNKTYCEKKQTENNNNILTS